MKNIIRMMLLVLAIQNIYGQEKSSLKLGSSYMLNATGFWNTQQKSLDSLSYSFVPRFTMGVGILANKKIKTNWNLTGELQYFKAGSDINYDITTITKPSYSFEYIGLNIGGQYNLSPQEISSFFFKASIPLNILVQSEYRTTTLSRINSDSVNRFDTGLSVATGYLQKFENGQQLQLEIYASIGLLNVFRGRIYENGLSAYNFMTGIKFAYLVSL